MNDYEWLTQMGLCHKCRKEKCAPGKKYCFECLEIIREDNRKRYDQEKAKEYQIEIVENKPLARMLYHNVELGEQVPQELYQAVAEVLAMVYHMQGKI